MIQYFFAIFLALMPHNNKTVSVTAGTTQVTTLGADDTVGETGHIPPPPPRPTRP